MTKLTQPNSTSQSPLNENHTFLLYRDKKKRKNESGLLAYSNVYNKEFTNFSLMKSTRRLDDVRYSVSTGVLVPSNLNCTTNSVCLKQ